MYQVPYPFNFDCLMLSSEVMQKLGFVKHQYPQYVEWVIVSHHHDRDYTIREIVPHIDYNLDYGRYVGTQFELPRSETKIYYLHDLLEHIPCLDPTFTNVVVENAKKNHMYHYFISYYDYKFRHGGKQKRPTPYFN